MQYVTACPQGTIRQSQGLNAQNKAYLDCIMNNDPNDPNNTITIINLTDDQKKIVEVCPTFGGSSYIMNTDLITGEYRCLTRAGGELTHGKINISFPLVEAPPVEVPPVEAPPVEVPPVEVPPVKVPPVEAHPPTLPNTINITCPIGHTYSSTSNEGITKCDGNVQTVVSITCPAGYSYTNATTNGIITCTQQVQHYTSNVYEFKSRKGRNVENFSQNTNGKCKARY